MATTPIRSSTSGTTFSETTLTPHHTHLKSEFDPRSPTCQRSPLDKRAFGLSTPSDRGSPSSAGYVTPEEGNAGSGSAYIDPRSPTARRTPPSLAKIALGNANAGYKRSPLGPSTPTNSSNGGNSANIMSPSGSPASSCDTSASFADCNDGSGSGESGKVYKWQSIRETLNALVDGGEGVGGGVGPADTFLDKENADENAVFVDASE